MWARAVKSEFESLINVNQTFVSLCVGVGSFLGDGLHRWLMCDGIIQAGSSGRTFGTTLVVVHCCVVVVDIIEFVESRRDSRRWPDDILPKPETIAAGECCLCLISLGRLQTRRCPAGRFFFAIVLLAWK